MPLIEIDKVALAPLDADKLWGRYLGQPNSGERLDCYSLNVVGWVLGKKSPAVAIEVRGKGLDAQRCPINIRRENVVAKFPHHAGSVHCGFQTSISLLPHPMEFSLVLRAVLEDDSFVPIATIRGRRSPFRTDFQPKLQPLLITTLGRSGSTWLTALLGKHPQIITYKPFVHEPRVGSYWMEVFKTLSEPASYLQSIRAEVNGKHWWVGAKRASPLPLLVNEPGIQHHLTRDTVEELAAFCQSRIEAFYTQAAYQEKKSPVFFAERFYGTSAFAIRLMWELYRQAREIILVRDFRDLICSIFAFNKKVGLTRFGREKAKSDLEFVSDHQERYRGLLRNWNQRRDRAFLLRYEDLVRHPEETLKPLLEYVEIDSSAATILETLQRAREFAPEQQERHRTTKAPSQSIGRWRRDLDPSLQAVCSDGFEDVLKAFGYDAGSDRDGD